MEPGTGKALRQAEDLVIITGGDEPLDRISRKIHDLCLDRPPPVAILAAGTAKNIARALGRDTGVRELVAAIDTAPPPRLP